MDRPRIAAEISAWYAANARDLAWRRPGTTPWGVMVSEFMLQQTPAARVTPVWLAWIERWPTPVSYTHLDVYKRQRLRLDRRRGAAG